MPTGIYIYIHMGLMRAMERERFGFGEDCVTIFPITKKWEADPGNNGKMSFSSLFCSRSFALK